MEVFEPFLATIEDQRSRNRTEEVFSWVHATFPSLVPKIAWNQPMFTDHGTFIISFSVAKHHLSVSPDVTGMKLFSEEIERAGYTQTINLFRIKWVEAVDYALLQRIIQFNIDDKKDCKTFWKKL
ncbi:iron chaperone [Sphaerochaeta sp. PS]|uniref:iron chaperone n=1 Tax=Sphaerochaeta sp. PS TaxID=3076336 RepID=UPI0028A4EA42|nr:iron chaperone [Sphaerochaeta sp. PS]MDT4761352.1 iron chaperone [Sphaerochaeta sp. PS]